MTNEELRSWARSFQRNSGSVPRAILVLFDERDALSARLAEARNAGGCQTRLIKDIADQRDEALVRLAEAQKERDKYRDMILTTAVSRVSPVPEASPGEATMEITDLYWVSHDASMLALYRAAASRIPQGRPLLQSLPTGLQPRVEATTQGNTSPNRRRESAEASPLVEPCQRCRGTGYIPSETCTDCVDCQDVCPACSRQPALEASPREVVPACPQCKVFGKFHISEGYDDTEAYLCHECGASFTEPAYWQRVSQP